MAAETDGSMKVKVHRMTAAEAADLLRDFERTVEGARVESEYAARIAETIGNLDDALQDENSDSRDR